MLDQDTKYYQTLIIIWLKILIINTLWLRAFYTVKKTWISTLKGKYIKMSFYSTGLFNVKQCNFVIMCLSCSWVFSSDRPQAWKTTSFFPDFELIERFSSVLLARKAWKHVRLGNERDSRRRGTAHARANCAQAQQAVMHSDLLTNQLSVCGKRRSMKWRRLFWLTVS